VYEPISTWSSLLLFVGSAIFALIASRLHASVSQPRFGDLMYLRPPLRSHHHQIVENDRSTSPWRSMTSITANVLDECDWTMGAGVTFPAGKDSSAQRCPWRPCLGGPPPSARDRRPRSCQRSMGHLGN
jgi:hypothetical protein